jgi:hypothetical protein
MKRRWVFVFTTAVAAVLILSAPAVYGDQVTTFNLTTDYSQPVGEAFGTVTIDTTTGTVDAIDLSFVGEPGSVFPIGTNSDLFGTGPNQLMEIFEAWDDAANDSYYSVDIVLPIDTLVGYAGGNICSTTNSCYSLGGFAYGIAGDEPYTGGQLEPVPELPGVLLFGTGALSLVGLLRRKFPITRQRRMCI